MSFNQKKDGAAQRGNGGGEAAGPAFPERKTPGRKDRRRPPASEVGDALKAAYNRALDEDIPPEMLDLLGKLG